MSSKLKSGLQELPRHNYCETTWNWPHPTHSVQDHCPLNSSSKSYDYWRWKRSVLVNILRSSLNHINLKEVLLSMLDQSTDFTLAIVAWWLRIFAADVQKLQLLSKIVVTQDLVGCSMQNIAHHCYYGAILLTQHPGKLSLPSTL